MKPNTRSTAMTPIATVRQQVDPGDDQRLALYLGPARRSEAEDVSCVSPSATRMPKVEIAGAMTLLHQFGRDANEGAHRWSRVSVGPRGFCCREAE
jgi:hypothetical protein